MIEIRPIDGRFVAVAPDRRLPRWNFDRYREACDVAGARYDREAGAHVAPIERLERVERCLVTAGFVTRVDPALRAHSRGSSVPDPPRVPPAGKTPYPFQVEGIEWLRRNIEAGNHRLLADEQGTGKTMELLNACPPHRPIIVVTLAAAVGVWASPRGETRAWRPDLVTTPRTGRKLFRWPLRGELLATSFDSLPDTFSAPLAGTILIFDEVHKLKNPQTRRTKRGRALAQAVRANGGVVIGASGTPLVNKIEELREVLVGLGLPPFEWDAPCPELTAYLKTVMLRRRRVDVLPQLPTKTYREIPVLHLPAATQALCDELVRRLAAAGLDLEDATKTVELSQIESLDRALCSKIRRALAEAKIPTLLELVELHEEADDPLVVFSCHRAPVERLGRRRGWAVITGDVTSAQRKQIEEEFQAGHYRGLAMTIQAGGVALTLTRAHEAIRVDPDWTPAGNDQADDRLCRIGQGRGVIITDLVAEHLIDQHAAKVTRRKQQLINATVETAAVCGPSSVEEGLPF